jgi:hypothetical protein
LSVGTMAVVAGAVVVKGLIAPATLPTAALVAVAQAGINVGQMWSESGPGGDDPPEGESEPAAYSQVYRVRVYLNVGPVPAAQPSRHATAHLPCPADEPS